MQLSWPYRQTPHDPFWGPVTSQANFCEEDYIITSYIAEFISTLTNLTYLFYAYHGIKGNSNRQDAILRNLPYLGIAGVGLGSIAFHSTLKNYTQWCDDLSMLIATTVVLHRIFTFDKSLRTTVLSGVLLTTFMAMFITWHCITDELVMHQVIFGIEIALVGLKTRRIISMSVSNRAVRQEVKKLALWGGVTFISGFVLWNIDNYMCTSLRAIRHQIGMPWSFILELHGWWHIFTGIGAYTFIALVEYLTSEEAGQPVGDRFAWPVGVLVTECGKKPSSTSPNVKGMTSKVNRNGFQTHGPNGAIIMRK